MEPRVQAVKRRYHWTNADIAALFNVTTNTVVNWCQRSLPGKLHAEVFDLLILLHEKAEQRGVAPEVIRRIGQAARKGSIPLIVAAHSELQALE